MNSPFDSDDQPKKQFVDYDERVVEAFDTTSRHPVDDASTFRLRETRRLAEWWYSFAPKMPLKNQFDIIDFRDVAPHLFMVACLSKGRFEYRLNGEALVRLVGYSQRGITYSANDRTDPLNYLGEYHQHVIESRKPWRCYGNLSNFDRDFVPFESIDFPLCNEEGQITHIMGAIIERTGNS